MIFFFFFFFFFANCDISVCVSVVSFVAIVLLLFVPHLSVFRYLGKVVLRDCGVS